MMTCRRAGVVGENSWSLEALPPFAGLIYLRAVVRSLSHVMSLGAVYWAYGQVVPLLSGVSVPRSRHLWISA